MSSLIRKRGDLWVTGHGYLVQSHATWREAAESLAVIRRFRRKALGISERASVRVSRRGTVTKRCTYGPCKETQDPGSQWGMCSWCDEATKENLAMHRGRKNPR